jgi:tellurite resistance protein TerC
MIAGASWGWWVGFHLAVVALLIVDGALHRGADEAPASPDSSSGRIPQSPQKQTLAWVWTTVLAIAAAVFAGWIAVAMGHRRALEWVAGYSIEVSLSVDNLFVFLVLFEGFRITRKRQHRALQWGIAGAVVLRALFIALGVTLIQRFDWVTWIFGLILVYAAWRLVRGGSAKAAIPEWIRRLQPAKGSLLPVILAIEVTDLLFAVDSIPAVLSVSHDPFVVYTSNIAAVLGLRSLYFALASLLDRLRYLHFGLAALLGFAAFKMLAARWIDLPITMSLAVIGTILAVCAVVSMIARTRNGASGSQPSQ